MSWYMVRSYMNNKRTRGPEPSVKQLKPQLLTARNTCRFNCQCLPLWMPILIIRLYASKNFNVEENKRELDVPLKHLNNENLVCGNEERPTKHAKMLKLQRKGALD